MDMDGPYLANYPNANLPFSTLAIIELVSLTKILLIPFSNLNACVEYGINK